MADRPIIFSGPMIRALLEGRKSQTRRILNPQPYPLDNHPGYWNASGVVGGRICISDRHLLDLHKKPKPGDRLYVREHWRTSPAYDDLKPSEMGGEESIRYEADGSWESWGWGDVGCIDGGRFRQAMHMPRWASRITLDVTDVRVQRLRNISVNDAIAEGISGELDNGRTRVSQFRELWDSLNAERGFGWDANPWVVALTFDVIKQNIDREAA